VTRSDLQKMGLAWEEETHRETQEISCSLSAGWIESSQLETRLTGQATMGVPCSPTWLATWHSDCFNVFYVATVQFGDCAS